MYNDSLTEYLNKLTIEASSLVGWPSYVTTIVYDKKTTDTKSFIKSDISYEVVLDILFNSKKDIINNINKQIKDKVGNAINIYELPNKILHRLEKESFYYFLEEAYVVEYKDYYIYYMIGNNE